MITFLEHIGLMTEAGRTKEVIALDKQIADMKKELEILYAKRDTLQSVIDSLKS